MVTLSVRTKRTKELDKLLELINAWGWDGSYSIKVKVEKYGEHTNIRGMLHGSTVYLYKNACNSREALYSTLVHEIRHVYQYKFNRVFNPFGSVTLEYAHGLLKRINTSETYTKYLIQDKEIEAYLFEDLFLSRYLNVKDSHISRRFRKYYTLLFPNWDEQLDAIGKLM